MADDPTICGLNLEAGGGTAERRANATIAIGRVARVKDLRLVVNDETQVDLEASHELVARSPSP